MEWKQDDFLVTDGFNKMDPDTVYRLLSNSYWASERPKDVIVESMRNSICFGLFKSEKQIGFARVITDHVVFAWVCDVIIDPNFRGKGLGKWLINCIMEHPDLQVKTTGLATLDAHTLYEKYHFKVAETMQRVIATPKCWEKLNPATP